MVPQAVAHWALNFGDRLVLSVFVDDAAVGTYNLAYQFALPASLAVVAINQAVMPRYARAGRDGGSIGASVTDHLLLVGAIGMGVSLLGPALLDVLAPATYDAAVPLVPIIVLGITFFGWYLVPMDRIVLVVGHTRWVWIPTAIAAALNILLNFAAIPALGITAAAVNTAIAYGALLVMMQIYASRMNPGFDWLQPLDLLMGALPLVGAVVVGLMFIPTGNAGGVALRSGVAFAGFASMFAVRTLRARA
jgi:O-antigen/teichoic acid export membrane protein